MERGRGVRASAMIARSRRGAAEGEAPTGHRTDGTRPRTERTCSDRTPERSGFFYLLFTNSFFFVSGFLRLRFMVVLWIMVLRIMN
jgi:hypothetical protein